MTPRPAAQWPGQEQAGSGRCTLAWKIIGWNMFMNRRIVFCDDDDHSKFDYNLFYLHSVL